MHQNKENEIRLQFLEEATECLHKIEFVIQGAASFHLAQKEIDTVLRAAHSIKGGAAMMDLQALSDIARRLEDFFKGFKTQQQHPIEAELEGLLLVIVNHMRQVVTLNIEGAEADPQWLDCVVNPVFRCLQKFSDSTTPEDSMVLPENAQNTAVMLFETEVEGCLQHLESVLANQENCCLLEESITTAQELSSLGEMLELPALSSLCESIIQHLEANPTHVEEITRLALQEWRRSQSALLSGQALPTQLDFGIRELPLSIKYAEAYTGLDSAKPKIAYLPELPQVKHEFLPSSEHRVDCEANICSSAQHFEQINELYQKLTIHTELVVSYLEQLGSYLKCFTHRDSNLCNTYPQPTDPANIGFKETEDEKKLDFLISESQNLKLDEKLSTITGYRSKKDTILVVDDSITIRRVLSLALETSGYTVKSAEDGRDALRQLLQGVQVEAIICDIDMPNLDGYGFLTRIKSDPLFKHLPVVMLTSHNEDNYRNFAIDSGASDYFVKPFKKQEILESMKRLIP